MNGVLTRLAGRLRTGDLVTGISRLLALACLVGLVGMLPWLSGKDPALTILRATSSDREPTPEVLASIRTSIGIDGGPLHVIGHWLSGLARGDLGRSWVSGAAVGPEAVDAFEDELRRVDDLDWQVVVYSGSMHAFTEPGTDAPDHGAQFNAAAEARSWQAMKAFFAEVLV